jgi:hypothetical protein
MLDKFKFKEYPSREQLPAEYTFRQVITEYDKIKAHNLRAITLRGRVMQASIIILVIIAVIGLPAIEAVRSIGRAG